jgi:hypothetical protein
MSLFILAIYGTALVVENVIFWKSAQPQLSDNFWLSVVDISKIQAFLLPS